MLFRYWMTISPKYVRGEVFGNPAIVFALYVFNKGLGCSEAIALYGYSVISTMVQNAVRAIPLGQFAGQEIVLRSFSQLEKNDTGNSRTGRVLPWGQYAWS